MQKWSLFCFTRWTVWWIELRWNYEIEFVNSFKILLSLILIKIPTLIITVNIFFFFFFNRDSSFWLSLIPTGQRSASAAWLQSKTSVGTIVTCLQFRTTLSWKCGAQNKRSYQERDKIPLLKLNPKCWLKGHYKKIVNKSEHQVSCHCTLISCILGKILGFYYIYFTEFSCYWDLHNLFGTGVVGKSWYCLISNHHLLYIPRNNPGHSGDSII